MEVIAHTNLISLNKEKSLLIQVANGDEKAFEELFHAYHNQLGAYVLGWTKSISVAEDLVQDVFLKIWINREALSTIESFDKYLFILSRNYTFNALRQSAKERLKRNEWERYFEDDQNFDPETNTEDYIPLINEAVDRLPPQQQKVYILKRLKGLKYDEIAQQLNISPETARKHLAVALRNITMYVKSNLYFILLILAESR